jgi:hypothetical protein
MFLSQLAQIGLLGRKRVVTPSTKTVYITIGSVNVLFSHVHVYPSPCDAPYITANNRVTF